MTATAVSLLLAGLMTPGCASDTDYQDAIKQAETTKVELEQSRGEVDALEQQLLSLEKEVAGLTDRSNTLSQELKELRKTQVQEQLAFDDAVGRMHQAAIGLKAQNRQLRQDFEQQQKENIALAALVQRYSRELEESHPAPPAPAPVTRPAVAQILAPAVQTNGIAHQSDQRVVPSPTSPAAPAVPVTQKPVPVQPAPADEGWMAYIMSWLLTLWHLIF